MTVWIVMNPAACFSFTFSLFFFSCAWSITSHGFTVQGTKITIHALFITVHALKNIKNGSHDTIHTFKNYFATVLSVFSFQFLVSATISSIQTDPICPIFVKSLQTCSTGKKRKEKRKSNKNNSAFTTNKFHWCLCHLY